MPCRPIVVLAGLDPEAGRVARKEERGERVLPRASSLAAISRKWVARSANVMRCFSPRDPPVSPERSARECRSRPVPPACSVNANATTASPVGRSAETIAAGRAAEVRHRPPRPVREVHEHPPGAGPGGAGLEVGQQLRDRKVPAAVLGRERQAVAAELGSALEDAVGDAFGGLDLRRRGEHLAGEERAELLDGRGCRSRHTITIDHGDLNDEEQSDGRGLGSSPGGSPAARLSRRGR